VNVVVGDPSDSLTVIDMLARRIEICQYVVVDTLDVTNEPELCCAPLLRSTLDEEQASELAEVLKALADPVRLRLVSIIGTAEAGEVCACDLPALVERSQPTVSHHLSMLVKAGVLEREQRGKWAWFRVRPERLAELGDALVSTR
jgi:ArsR family transcriptional regulator